LLAARYAQGDGVEANQAEASRWYLKAAQAGDPSAMYEISRRYFSGYGVEKSEVEYKDWLRKAADGGYPKAQHDMSFQFGSVWRKGGYVFSSQPGDPDEKAKQLVFWLSKASDSGLAAAKHRLAMIGLLGVRKNIVSEEYLIPPASSSESAIQLLRMNADGGHWESQWALGTLFQAGFREVKPDAAESTKWWQRLDSQTDASVQSEIGFRYLASNPKYYKTGDNRWNGKDLTFDETNSVAWSWFTKAAAQGNGGAMWQMSHMEDAGLGVPKNSESALQNEKRAANVGHADAMYWMGTRYTHGRGVPIDYSVALDWFKKAVAAEGPYGVNSSRAEAQNALGVFHENGYGLSKDAVIAYAWYNLSAAGGYEKARENLSRVQKVLTPEDLSEAQKLSREWSAGKLIERTTRSAASGDGTQTGTASSATGFFISTSGDILTNHHVVADCKEIRVPALSTVGKVRVADKVNDLALVKIEGKDFSPLVFSPVEELKQGEEISVFGFPLDGYLPSSGNFTQGIVAALAGPANNSSLIQITSPVQPGNSGGPVLNKRGEVVGVVVGKANVIKLAKVTGDIAQNINFAIAGRTVTAFLDGNLIKYSKRNNALSLFSSQKSSSELADLARQSSVKLECLR